MYAGDDWEIRVTLLQDTGDPYDLSFPHSVLWKLVDQLGVAVIDPAEVTVNTIDSPGGIVQILVPHTVTTRLNGGLHSDYLRIIFQNVTSSLSTGKIIVTGDPFFATVTDTGNLINARPKTITRSVVVTAVGSAVGHG